MCLPITLNLENDYDYIDCPDCNGSGEELDHSKINCRTISPPYKECDTCQGLGKVEIDGNTRRELKAVY